MSLKLETETFISAYKESELAKELEKGREALRKFKEEYLAEPMSVHENLMELSERQKAFNELYERQKNKLERPIEPLKITPYDQTRKFDGDKLKYELVPVEVIEELAKILTYGAKKYAPNEWKKVEPFDDRYYAALMRHLMEWRKGNHVDDESEHLHLSHAFCCLAFLLSREVENQHD